MKSDTETKDVSQEEEEETQCFCDECIDSIQKITDFKEAIEEMEYKMEEHSRKLKEESGSKKQDNDFVDSDSELHPIEEWKWIQQKLEIFWRNSK